MDGIARQGDQFARAQARAIEQLDQCREPQIVRAGMRGARPLGDGGEQPIDIGMAEYLGQRPPLARTGQHRRGIIGAQPLLMQKGIETPQRRRLARHGGIGQRRPAIGQPLERALIGLAQSVHRLGGKAQVGAIGRQRIARRASLRRHHLQKAVDQRGVVHLHVRAIASAAIIRASLSNPTARNASTIRYSAWGGTPRQSLVCIPTAHSRTTMPVCSSATA